MTAANGERYCSQHHQPRSQCRPSDRHTQPLRAGDGLMAAVAARGGAIGLSSVNDALEMALEAWLRLPLEEVAEQALADRRIRRMPDGVHEWKAARNKEIVAAARSGKSLPRIADEHGLTRQYVRQIVSAAGLDDAPAQPAPPGAVKFMEPAVKP